MLYYSFKGGDDVANKKFGDTLRTLRNQKGFTQQQVADMLGLKNKSTLGSWEVGKSEPDGYTLLRLCKLYNIKDIYSAFDEIPSVQYEQGIDEEGFKKYYLLSDESKKIVDNLILQLLEMQENRNKTLKTTKIRLPSCQKPVRNLKKNIPLLIYLRRILADLVFNYEISRLAYSLQNLNYNK